MMTTKFTLPGTTRSRTPEDTLQRILPLLLEFGISSLSHDTALQTLPLPVYQCVRPLGKSISVTQGKGLTADLSKISAIMEAIEFAQAENLPTPHCVAAYAEIENAHLYGRQPRAVNPLDIANYAHHSLLTQKLAWVTGLDLNTHESVLLPRAYFDMDYTRTYPEQMYLRAISNGLASGNSWSEAVVHGVLELIERHGVGRTKQMKIADRVAQLVNVETVLEAVSSPELKEVIHVAQKLNYKILIENLSHDLGLPCFNCEIQYVDLFAGYKGVYPFRGSGCHFNREIALSRALTEAVQSAVTIVSGAKDNLLASRLPQSAPIGYPTDAISSLEFEQIPNGPQHASFEEDLQFLLRRLKDHGFHAAYTLDLTSQKFSIPVAFVVVPGMKYSWV